MDNNAFDNLTKAIGKGGSRRAMLKALFGLGAGAAVGAVLESDVSARSARTRPTVPPPSEPGCPSGEQRCAEVCCPQGRCQDGLCCSNLEDINCEGQCWPADQCTTSGQRCAEDQTVCGSICCDSGVCARRGNTDICCADALSCGLDCCTGPLQCCDRECCPTDSVCLTRAFGSETSSIEEETCCPIELTCDGRCCDGACFDPGGSIQPAAVLDVDRECCPLGGRVCPGESETRCCADPTPDCCIRGGAITCINREAQCCEDADCLLVGACGTGTCSDGACNYAADSSQCAGDCVSCELSLDGSYQCVPLVYGADCGTCHICDGFGACIQAIDETNPNVSCRDDDAGEHCCAGACSNTGLDELNCGTCGNVCASGMTCCRGECIDTNTHQEHCGGCENLCEFEQTCVDGACGVSA